MFNEEEFRRKAESEIARCRAGDWNHALRVVQWVKKLGKERNDLSLLIAAAYIHDIGWRDVMPSRKISFDELLLFEEEANKNSESYVREFLKKMNYANIDIATIIRLIAAADRHESIAAD